MSIIRAIIYKMHIGIANREDPDQTAFSEQCNLGLLCLSMAFSQATGVQSFRASTVNKLLIVQSFYSLSRGAFIINTDSLSG